MRFFIFISILLFVNCTKQGISQFCLTDLELTRISQGKVQEYIGNQKEKGIETFDEIKPSVQINTDFREFYIHENVYGIRKGLDEVWNKYLQLNPKKTWNGRKVSLGFLFSKKEKRIIYEDENMPHIDTGMVVYLNLRLMKGLVNMATAFEIVRIDDENKIIEFSYLSGNVSSGLQRLQFIGTAKGNTEIIHTSYYKSNNFAKNHVLYPYFHTRLTNEFHRNIKRMM
jgi:hypothetical protein